MSTSDVGSSQRGAGEGPKRLAVRQLKWYASWVQTVHALKRMCDTNKRIMRMKRIIRRLNGLNPRGIVRYVEMYCAKTYLRRSRVGMRAKKSTYIGEIQ